MSHSNMFVKGKSSLAGHENKNPKSKTVVRDQEVESKSVNDGVENQDQNPNKRKRYHRHTQHQIQEMEAFFKEHPHPDDKQQKELGSRLSLEPIQVKFWFQNKRTQQKARHERHDNLMLRTENEKLRAVNIHYKEALDNAICSTCGCHTCTGDDMSLDEQQLKIQNARLREEIDRISLIVTKYAHKSPLSAGASSSHNHETGINGDLYGASVPRSITGPTDVNKSMIIELANAAMEEFIFMAQVGDPLWISSNHVHESLNEDEYNRTVPSVFETRPMGFKIEASRYSAVVVMNHKILVELLMNVNLWSKVFASIVSSAMTLKVLSSTGEAGNYNGALQVMTAEYQVPSPLVPTRENYFARYCKRHDDRTWAIVDVSLDKLGHGSISGCRRRPSGCLIQKLSNRSSKVTWVENVEIDDREVNNIYKPLINSGLAFGARRWVATLDRYCERMASFITNISTNEVGVVSTMEGKRSFLKLGERMAVSLFSSIGASTTRAWTMVSRSGVDDVRIMTQKSMDDPGRPTGIVVSATTSFWLPVSPKVVFDFLRDENSRTEWDILSSGGHVHKLDHIANGLDPGNAISILCISNANLDQRHMLILQESSTNSTGSYVIYAPVDIVATNIVLIGGDTKYVALLPSGFVILPDGPTGQATKDNAVETGGSLLTVAFQILVHSVPTAKLSLGSVEMVSSLIKHTVERIKAAILAEDP